MTRIVLLIVMLIPFLVSASTTTTRYDFSERSPGVNIFAYEGASTIQVPNNNSFPSEQHSQSEYEAIAVNDGSGNGVVTTSNNSYASIRYVINIDENLSDISQIDFLWNGLGYNQASNSTQGVRIYFWNFSRNIYQLAAQTTSGNEVNLTLSAAGSSALNSYVDSTSNSVIVYIVSQNGASAGANNVILTDYMKLDIESTIALTPMANFQFDECEYFGSGVEVIDQLGNYSGTSHNNVNTSNDAQIIKALAIDNAQHHVQTNIPLPNSFSVSTWFKKPTDTTGNQFFVLGAMENGGDLLFLNRANGWKWAIYNGSSRTSISGNYSFADLDDNWHHLTLVYNTDTTMLYIDGNYIEQVGLTPSGTLKYIGTSFDDFSDANSQGFRAPLDEFIVFNGALTSAEISNIYQQQSNARNYDGSLRVSSVCPTLIANYKFDENNYAETPGEVIDSVGGFHGTTNNVQPVEGKICRALDLSAGGTQDYVELDNAVLDNKSAFSISVWAKTSKVTSQSIIGGASTGSHNELVMWFTSNTRFRPYIQDTQNGSLNVSSIADDLWRHIVWTQGDNKSCLYIDTVFQGCLNQTTSLLEIERLIIGQEQDSVGGGFSSTQAYNGLLDELVIFDGAIEQKKIEQIYNFQNNGLDLNGNAVDCPQPAIDHYEIVHDGNGLTCDAETITVKACADSSCSSLSAETVSLDFTIISPSTGNSVKSSPTFTGSTDIAFNHTVAETIILAIDGASIPAVNSVECTGFGNSCEMTFADAGFRFLTGDLNSEVISHQTAGVVFPETLKLQAVENNNGACDGLLSTTVSVELSQENVTPDLGFNPGLAFQTSAINIAKYPDYTDNIILNFGADSIATINSPKYLDAGKIRLHARYQDPLTGVTIVGSSNDFWVKPERFEISATNDNGNLNGVNSTSSITHQAGDNFSLTVSALNLEGDLTQNYRQSDGQLQLKVSRVAPVLNGSVDANFTYAEGQTQLTSTTAIFESSTISNFVDDIKGKSIFNGANFDEVGIINIDIQDNNYGNLGAVEGLVPANDITVGRFTPAYFKQTVKSEDKGRLDSYQSSVGFCSIANWAYSGQRTTDNKGVVSYSLEPKITITAYNANDQVTKNYTLGEPEGFMKLEASGIDINLPTHDDVQLKADNVVGNFVDVNAEMHVGSLSVHSELDKNLFAGEVLYTFSANDHFSYIRDDTSFLAPFTAQIPFVTAQVEDSDGILLSTNTNATEKVIPEGVEIRFGRMVLENSYGSENAPLRAPLKIEIFDGTTFNVHSDESCLSAAINDKKTGAKYSGGMNLWDYRLIDLESDAIAVDDTNASISGVFYQGVQSQLLFSPPGKQGVLEWEFEVPSWFKFKWNNLDEGSDGNFYDDNPSSVLSFGIYRGNDRIISWREVSN